jgi:proteasome lid subunit RPN8/RPN11
MRLGNDQLEKLKPALAEAGTMEIGGQLFGEQLAPSDFRITEVAIQARRGSFARFMVDLLEAGRNALRFFDRTQHQYKRFNYIGEWHSHPSFEVKPSSQDVETMVKLVAHPAFKGSFAILLIVRLDGDVVSMGAWLFDPQGTTRSIDLETGSGS